MDRLFKIFLTLLAASWLSGCEDSGTSDSSSSLKMENSLTKITFGNYSWVHKDKTFRFFEDKNLCIQRTGGGEAKVGDVVQLHSCSSSDLSSRQWNYDKGTGLIRSVANPKLCIHKVGSHEPKRGDKLHLWTCGNGSRNEQWTFESDTRVLRLRQNNKWCIHRSGRLLRRHEIHLWDGCPAQSKVDHTAADPVKDIAINITIDKDTPVKESQGQLEVEVITGGDSSKEREESKETSSTSTSNNSSPVNNGAGSTSESTSSAKVQVVDDIGEETLKYSTALVAKICANDPTCPLLSPYLQFYPYGSIKKVSHTSVWDILNPFSSPQATTKLDCVVAKEPEAWQAAWSYGERHVQEVDRQANPNGCHAQYRAGEGELHIDSSRPAYKTLFRKFDYQDRLVERFESLKNQARLDNPDTVPSVDYQDFLDLLDIPMVRISTPQADDVQKNYPTYVPNPSFPTTPGRRRASLTDEYFVIESEEFTEKGLNAWIESKGEALTESILPFKEMTLVQDKDIQAWGDLMFAYLQDPFNMAKPSAAEFCQSHDCLHIDQALISQWQQDRSLMPSCTNVDCTLIAGKPLKAEDGFKSTFLGTMTIDVLELNEGADNLLVQNECSFQMYRQKRHYREPMNQVSDLGRELSASQNTQAYHYVWEGFTSPGTLARRAFNRFLTTDHPNIHKRKLFLNSLGKMRCGKSKEMVQAIAEHHYNPSRAEKVMQRVVYAAHTIEAFVAFMAAEMVFAWFAPELPYSAILIKEMVEQGFMAQMVVGTINNSVGYLTCRASAKDRGLNIRETCWKELAEATTNAIFVMLPQISRRMGIKPNELVKGGETLEPTGKKVTNFEKASVESELADALREGGLHEEAEKISKESSKKMLDALFEDSVCPIP